MTPALRAAGLTPRLAGLALLFLVIPATVTALFLARNAERAIEPGLQPGGSVAGRVVSLGASARESSLGGIALDLVGVARDGTASPLASASTDASGQFAFEAAPFDGHYAIRVSTIDQLPTAVPFTLIDGPRLDLVVPLRLAARLELDFAARPGATPRAGTWALTGESSGSWFSAGGVRYERQGTFTGARLVVGGLPPSRASLTVKLDGGTRIDLVLDLAPGQNRSTIEL